MAEGTALRLPARCALYDPAGTTTTTKIPRQEGVTWPEALTRLYGAVAVGKLTKPDPRELKELRGPIQLRGKGARGGVNEHLRAFGVDLVRGALLDGPCRG